MPHAIQLYEVSLKALVVRDGRLLLLRESDTGWWELPGGRIDAGEEWAPHGDVLARELAEELGGDFRVDPTSHVLTWTRQRPADGRFLLIVARLCHHSGGEPRSSDEHDGLLWVDAESWRGLALPEPSGYREALERFWASGLATAGW